MHTHPVVHRQEICETLPNCSYILGSAFGVRFSFYGGIQETWTKCREVATIGLHQVPQDYLFFSWCSNFNNERYRWNVARWFWYLEGQMGWRDRTRVHATQHEHVVKVYPSGGWMQQSLIKSLLTLMLRISVKCDEGTSIDQVIDRHPQSQSSRENIWRFLDGYHHATYNSTHWNQICERVDKRFMLVRREWVEDRARWLWERNGRPQGKDSLFWTMAEGDYYAGRVPV